jgi:hypothetical protein
MPGLFPSCPTCGYSREGLPREVLCPECGGDPPTEAELLEKPRANRVLFAALLTIYILICALPSMPIIFRIEYGLLAIVGFLAAWWISWCAMMWWVTKQEHTRDYHTLFSISTIAFLGACPISIVGTILTVLTTALFTNQFS